MSDGLGALLARRIEEEGMSPEVSISVAELHRRLLPYPLCRSRAGIATKAEYDLKLLRLLADDASLHVAEPGLRTAVRAELALPEPGLALLQRFAASEVRLRSGGAMVADPGAEDEAGPPLISLETGRSRGALVPGLDDIMFVPGPAQAPSSGAPLPEESDPTAAGPTDARTDAGRSVCRRCRGSLPDRDSVNFCPHCGADQSRWPCPACDAEVERGWRYCAACGKMLPDS